MRESLIPVASADAEVSAGSGVFADIDISAPDVHATGTRTLDDPSAGPSRAGSTLLGPVSEGDRVDEFGWRVFTDKFSGITFPVGTRFEFSTEKRVVLTASVVPQGVQMISARRELVGWDAFWRAARSRSTKLRNNGVVRIVQPAVGETVPGHVWETGRFLHHSSRIGFGPGTRVRWKDPESGTPVLAELRDEGWFPVPHAGAVLPVAPVMDMQQRMGQVPTVQVKAVPRKLTLTDSTPADPPKAQWQRVLELAMQGKTDAEIGRAPGMYRNVAAEILPRILTKAGFHGDSSERLAWLPLIRELGWLRRDPLPGDMDYLHFGRNPATGAPVPFTTTHVDLLFQISRRKPDLEMKNNTYMSKELGVDVKRVKKYLSEISTQLGLKGNIDYSTLVRTAREWGFRLRNPSRGMWITSSTSIINIIEYHSRKTSGVCLNSSWKAQPSVR